MTPVATLLNQPPLKPLISTIRTISTKLENLENTLAKSKVKPSLQVDPSVQPIPTHIRLEVLRFNSNDPLGWTFNVNHFFIIIGLLMSNGCILPLSIWNVKLSVAINGCIQIKALEHRFPHRILKTHEVPCSI